MAGGRSTSRISGTAASLWAAVPQNAPLALAILGLVVYGLVWTAYSIFYRSFGLTPRDVGISYGEIVQEAAVAVVVYMLIVLLAVGGHYLLLRRLHARLPGWYKQAAVWFGVAAAFAYPCVDAYLSGRHAKRGDGVEIGGGWFPLPIGLPLAAPRVSVRFSEPGAATASGIAPGDCVVYLGATNETTVVWVLDENRRNGRVVQVPKRVTVVDGSAACDEA